MSLLYRILKPIVRKVIKGSSLHQEESYEEFKRESYKVQARFRFSLPELRGLNSGTSSWMVFVSSSGERRPAIPAGRSCTFPAEDPEDGSCRPNLP